MDSYIAMIMMFAGNFAPRGWMFCHGQILSIAQNTALFSLLGTTYGGNGQTTFALPDLAGRVPVGTGQGPGLSYVSLGDRGGVDTMALTQAHLPTHSHVVHARLPVSASNARVSSPVTNVLAVSADEIYAPASAATDTMEVTAEVGPAGGGLPFSLMQPYLGMNFVICVEGIYPSRN